MTVIPLPFSPLSLSPKKLVSELKELRGEVEEWGGGAGWGRFPVAEPCTGGEFKRWGSSLGITPCPAAIYFTFGNLSFHVTLSIHLTLSFLPHLCL